ADDNLYKNTKRYFEQIATNRKLYDMPADAKAVKKLSVKYKNEALGIINVKRDNDDVIFDFGEFQSRVTTKQNGDGTISFIAIDPEFFGAEFVVGSESKPQLIFRDAQHEYIFEGL
ncbi:MAG: serine hydrolase, partial [Gammaproteobacteria bacterium]|nr:serine hydrolase [Gammaproteobacteria bacterium]